MMETLPSNFVRTQTELLGAGAGAWLASLPLITAACAGRWNLRVERVLEPLTYNYLLRARCADGTPVILKICSPGGEFVLQAAALQLFDGHGAVRLLDADPEDQVMVLECCEPGMMLRSVEDDEEATSVAAAVMRQLWRPAPEVHPLPMVADWGQGFQRMRFHFDGGSGPVPPALADQAERLFEELERSMEPPVVLHGDLHHDNILSAGRAPWLVIDPKGLIGEPAYETGALLRNRLPEPVGGAEAGRVLARRIAQLAEELGLDRTRIWGWALAQAVLSAWWTIEDHGQGAEETIAMAEQVATLRL